MRVICTTVFHVCKDFLFPNEESTSYTLLFYKRFDRKVVIFLLIQDGCFLKIAKSDLLEIPSYLIPNKRMESYYIW